MAIYKQGQLCQWVVPLVDKTDFASIESGVTSNITCALITYKQGSSAATSTVTLSRVPSVVASGIFRITAKATETSGLDDALLKITHASCAMQLIPVCFQIQDASDVLSKIRVATTGTSDFESKLLSRVPSLLATASGISDMVSDLISKAQPTIAAAVWSDFVSKVGYTSVSNLFSYLSDVDSKLLSRTPKAVATASILSNVHSHVDKLTSRITKGAALASNLTLFSNSALSDLTVLKSRVPAIAATSDMVSKVRTTLSLMGGNKHMASLVWDGAKANYADAGSMGSVMQAVGTTGLTASDISDIASAVWKMKYNTHSLASSFGSAFEVLLSNVSDLTSRITSTVNSTSDFVSKIWGHSAATVMKSRMSNTDSAVNKLTSRVPKMAATDSGMTVVYNSLLSEINGLSDILSNVRAYVVNNSDITSKIWKATSTLSDTGSKLLSRVPKGVATASGLTVVYNSLLSEVDGASDILSKVYGHTTGMSDILSKVYVQTTGNSDIMSKVWKATSTLSDTGSKLLSRVPKAVATASFLSDAHSDLKSQMGALTVTLTASDISDIASAAAAAVGAGVASQVWANAAASALKSQISDIESALDSQFAIGHPLNASDMSDLRSAITAAGISASDMSDIRSAIAAGVTNQSDIESKLGKLASRITKPVATASALSDLHSDFQSRVPKAVATNSQVSDLVSNLKAYAVGASDVLSNIHADLADLSDITSKVRMEVLGVDSLLSNVHADLADLSGIASDIKSDALVAESRISDIYSLLEASTKGAERFITASGKYKKFATDGVTQLWSHVVASDATSVVRGAGA